MKMSRPETLKIPDEIARREKRLAKLREAKTIIEARHATRLAEKQRDYEAKLDERKSRRDRGERVGGRDPKPPTPTPETTDPYNFTDPESRIMKAGNGEHFEQSYNAQAAVDVEGSLLVMGAYVTDAPNDKQQLVTAVASVVAVREVTHVLADTGYFSTETVEPVFGIIKSAMGFRQFRLRGMCKVAREWSRVTWACNFRRLARLIPAATTRCHGDFALQTAQEPTNQVLFRRAKKRQSTSCVSSELEF